MTNAKSKEKERSEETAQVYVPLCRSDTNSGWTDAFSGGRILVCNIYCFILNQTNIRVKKPYFFTRPKHIAIQI